MDVEHLIKSNGDSELIESLASASITAVGLGALGGLAAYGGVTAAGAIIGGTAATGIGLVVAIPIATIFGLRHLMWTRKGQADD